MRSARGSGARENGFLLAEALVTMAISAFLLVALGSLVQLVLRADARAAAVAEDVEAASRAIDALGRDLRGAARTRWAGGEGAPFVFGGDARTLRFALVDPASGDTRLVTLEAGEGVPLARRSVSLAPVARGFADIDAGAEAVPIYSGRLAVRFGYFSALPDGGEVLADVWAAALRMPVGVRVAFVEPTSGTIVRSVRIPLMVDAEPGCAAPARARCSYVETGEADALSEADLPREAVDPDDPLGWLRYAR